MKNEVQPVADAAGVGEQYKRLSQSGKIDHSQIEKWLKLLHGKSEDWIAKQMIKAEPYEGSTETINYLKNAGFEPVVITDDMLMYLEKCNKAIRKKLGVKEIIPTAEIEYHGGKICGGLKNIRTKPEILEELVAQRNPSKLLCMVQGENDYGMALSARKIGATVISVNSHSQELESMSHYHIGSIAEAPELLSRILV